MNTVFLKSTFGGIEIGDWQSVRVNCNVGANTPEERGDGYCFTNNRSQQ